MNNLEWLKKNLSEEEKESEELCHAIYEKLNGVNCYTTPCNNCYFNKCENILDFLLEEHKEPIKLKQWEYDLIRTNDRPHECNVFESFNTYRNMKAIGYFKGITNTSMTLKEILENCEIVSDNYEGFDDCK